MTVAHLNTLSLPDGRRAELYHARPPLPPAEGARLGWFMEMVFGGYDKPDIFVVATAKGMYETDARNDFVWAEIDGEVVSTVWTITPADDARIGGLGEVFTVPSARGQGLARQTCAAILDLFDMRGGQCIFLGTSNPTAARLYAELGFVPYPEGLMRRAVPDFEMLWFAPATVTFRPVRWGDIPRLVALYSAPNSWISACYPQGFFSADLVQHGRCNSFLKHTWQGTLRGLWLGMFSTATGALVGSCPVYPRGNEREFIGGELDLFVHPTFARHAADLLDEACTALRARGWRWLMAQLPAHDREKRAIFERRGFTRIATLPDALSIGGETQDVHILRTDL